MNNPYTFILISAFTHAYLNFIFKASANKHIIIALGKVCEVLFLGIPAVIILVQSGLSISSFGLIIIAAVLTFLNHFFLSKAYEYGDLSLAYPLSRSSALFIPFLSLIFIDSPLTGMSIISVVTVFIGITIMHLKDFKKESIFQMFTYIKTKSAACSILAALCVACYTIWHNFSIQQINPILYLFSYTLITAFVYMAYCLAKFSKLSVMTQLKIDFTRILITGILGCITYLLILYAMKSSMEVTHIGAIRQISVIAALILGVAFLNENLTPTKVIGAIISILGVLILILH